MSILQQLARNRAAFAALAGGDYPQPRSGAEQIPDRDWRLGLDTADRWASQPSTPVPTLPVRTSETVIQPLRSLSTHIDPPLPPASPAMQVYSLDQPPAARKWDFTEHTVSASSLGSESVPAVTDIRFPELAAESTVPAPFPEVPLQALLRQLETDARRSPQLHTEEERL